MGQLSGLSGEDSDLRFRPSAGIRPATSVPSSPTKNPPQLERGSIQRDTLAVTKFRRRLLSSRIIVVMRVKPMTTVQAILFGMMLSWTPSVVLLAWILWKEDIGID